MRRWPVSPGATSLALGFALVLLGLAKYGADGFPQSGTFFEIAAHWQDPRSSGAIGPTNDYLLTNSAGAALAGLLGLASQRWLYSTFQIALTCLAIVLPFLMPACRAVPQRAKAIFVLVAGGPVLALLVLWVGGYDALSIIGATLVGLHRRRWVLGVGWFLIGVNHTSIALIGLAIWLPVMWLGRHDTPRRELIVDSLVSAGAVATGVVGWAIVVAGWGGARSRLDLLLSDDYVDYYLRPYWPGILIVALSTLGLGWLLLGALGWRGSHAARLIMLAALVAAAVISLIGKDQTRDAALCLQPAVLATVVYLFPGRDDDPDLGRAWWLLGIAVAILPTVLVFGWDATLHGWGT